MMPAATRLRHGLFALVLCLAAAVRLWDLSAAGMQTDEQIWHERSVRFVQSLLGPLAPAIRVPEVFWSVRHVDLTTQRLAMPAVWPFTIRMPAHHPGTPMGFAIGMSYVFLAKDGSSASLGLLPEIAALRLPNAVVGILLVAVVYLGGRRLVSSRAALAGAALAAVEPMLVGYGRVARLDQSVALWTAVAFFAYLTAQQRRDRRWAAAAGAALGLGLATNTYALFIMPALLAVRFVHGTSPATEWRRHGFRLWRWLDRLDWTVLGWMFGTLVAAFPNLWPNPLLGLWDMVSVQSKLPHATGNIQPKMPLSRWFYVTRLPEHILPATLALAAVGTVLGLRRHPRAAALLTWWVAGFILCLIVPPGYRETKNVLSIFPPLFLLGGLAIDEATLLLGPRRQRAALAIAIVLVAATGVAAVAAWWPYPRLYTWSWRPDPQTIDGNRDIVGEGEGMREALAFIRRNGPADAKVICYTGTNAAQYDYDRRLLLPPPRTPEEMAGADWMIVLPKVMFTSRDDLPMAVWFWNQEPAYVVRAHQVGLAWVYRVPGGRVAPP